MAGGGLPQMGVTGRIAPEHQAQPGRVLCVWGDAGWGSLVCQGKSRDGRFADQLVEACAAMVRSWAPQPAPAWVTCIPSRRHPNLVPDFARRLATALNLPFHPVLEKTDDRPAQKEMANSSQQARNVDGSLRIRGNVPAGPVLLVDDMVDSRWTLTVAAYVLTSNGSGPVYPLALASTANADDDCATDTQYAGHPVADRSAHRGAQQRGILRTADVKGIQPAGPLLREKQKQPADLIEPGAEETVSVCAVVFGRERLESLLGSRVSAESGGGSLAGPGHLGRESRRRNLPSPPQGPAQRGRPAGSLWLRGGGVAGYRRPGGRWLTSCG